MKKTLIALAVLAASGASFAQVTITGNLTMGYASVTTGGVGASADSSGLGVDTSEIDFAATEDLGGGYKATAKLALAGADRSNEGGAAVAGRDASLTLTTPVGALVLGSARAADYLSGGLAGVGAYYQGWDNKVLSQRNNRDTITFLAPVGPVTVGVTYQEAANLQGLGAGTTGASAATGSTLGGLVVSYAQGPLAANYTYLSFNSNTGAAKDQNRLSANYDLGVAKLGGGTVITAYNNAASSKITDYLFGASVPMGAVTLGAEWVSRKYENLGAAVDGTATGTSLQVSYALSKRTAVLANYARWTTPVVNAIGSPSGVLAGADSSSMYLVGLSHSF